MPLVSEDSANANYPLDIVILIWYYLSNISKAPIMKLATGMPLLPVFLFVREMPNETEVQDEEKVFELSDLDVSTIGLVSAGAVGVFDEQKGVNFFLLKSQGDGPMSDSDELVIEEVQEQEAQTETETETPAPEQQEDTEQSPKPTLGDRVKGIFRSKDQSEEADKADPAALRTAARTLRQGGYEVDPEELGRRLADTATDDDEEMEAGKKPTKKAASEETPMNDNQLAAIEAVHKAHTETLLASIRAEHKAQLDAMTEAVEKQYETKLTGLEQRVQKAEQEKLEADEARQKRELLEKAVSFRMLPVPTTELADHLFTIKKSVPAETYDWLEAAIKAVDAQLGAAGIFAEAGTARTAEEATLTEKVKQIAKEKDIPFSEAMLELSEADQLVYLNEMRKAGK